MVIGLLAASQQPITHRKSPIVGDSLIANHQSSTIRESRIANH
jgi:hypothetical protein